MSGEEDEIDREEERSEINRFVTDLGPHSIITANNFAVHYNSSPYSYAFSNPISYIDPIGLDTAKVINLKKVEIKDVLSTKNLFPLGPILLGFIKELPKKLVWSSKNWNCRYNPVF